MIQPTFSTDIGTSFIEPIDTLTSLPGGIIKSNLSWIPPHMLQYFRLRTNNLHTADKLL
jgi:hypothetical protein